MGKGKEEKRIMKKEQENTTTTKYSQKCLLHICTGEVVYGCI